MTLHNDTRMPAEDTGSPLLEGATPACTGELPLRLATRHAGERELRLRWECVGPADALSLIHI